MLRSDRRPRHPNLRHPGQRLAFAALYGPLATVYDRFTGWLFLGEWARRQATALALVPVSARVVELGAGTGALAATARAAGRTWIAVEPSPAMIGVAARRGRAVSLVQASAGSLPIAAGTVDAVVATFPTSYLLDAATASEVRRVLRHGGMVVVVLSGTLSPDGRRRRIHRGALRQFYGPPAASTPIPCALPGFTGEVRLVPTYHGSATVYIGTLAPTSVATGPSLA